MSTEIKLKNNYLYKCVCGQSILSCGNGGDCISHNNNVKIPNIQKRKKNVSESNVLFIQNQKRKLYQ